MVYGSVFRFLHLDVAADVDVHVDVVHDDVNYDIDLPGVDKRTIVLERAARRQPSFGSSRFVHRRQSSSKICRDNVRRSIKIEKQLKCKCHLLKQ